MTRVTREAIRARRLMPSIVDSEDAEKTSVGSLVFPGGAIIALVGTGKPAAGPVAAAVSFSLGLPRERAAR
ncbi:hypothetical protein Aab01nite_07520 [Paractinoplanes abujensis]|nr:hypothetical protein Aab01nite_07520 [Actinoplanes abujensis]